MQARTENGSPKNIQEEIQPNPTLRKNRVFVLDTNVLLHDSQSIFSFKGVVVGIPFVVLEELDTFKKDPGERGRNARQIIRSLDELRSRGCLSDGVALNHKTSSILKVLPTPHIEDVPEAYGDIADNLIIQTVKNLVDANFEVTFVTKDINSRVKADSLGLDAEDYKKGTITSSSEDFYKGWHKIQLPALDLKKITLTKLPELLLGQKKEFHPNEFIILESENNPEHSRLFRFMGGKSFKEVTDKQIIAHFGARNIQQLMALDLLRDDNVKMVSLIGSAGTGKTFLTLLLGLQKVAQEHLYRRFLISRPVIALGADIGYLPGEVEEKLRYWMEPVYDNLDFIFSQVDEYKEEILAHHETKKERRYKKRHQKERYQTRESDVDLLVEKGILSLEAITYMRGRSIPYQFVFIDEVQNLNPHEVKTIVSRAGEGTKIILAGDPFQIDSPYLDFSSNGLTVTTEKFKKEAIFGTVFLEKSERSELAKLAARLL